MKTIPKPAKSKKSPKVAPRRVITLSEAAYDTILETLNMDAQSSAFDADLRAEITAALEDIREVAPVVEIEVLGGVAYIEKCPDYVKATIRDLDNLATGH